MKKTFKYGSLLPTILMVTFALTGCASIVDGSSQSLSVKTVSGSAEVAGASCQLTNDKGTWFLTTPGTVTVHRSYDPLNVKCTDAGYQPGLVTSTSSTKGMAFGNILAGGLIGAGVDMSTGAAYDYPALITVPMAPDPQDSSKSSAQTSAPAATGTPSKEPNGNS